MNTFTKVLLSVPLLLTTVACGADRIVSYNFMGQSISVNCSAKSIQDPNSGEWKNLRTIERENGKAGRLFSESLIVDACES